MDDLGYLQLLDYGGVFVFAITGALVASRKEMDVFGFLVMAAMPAVGGGTLRDLMLDLPVFWIYNTHYIYIVVAAALFTFMAHRKLSKRLQAIAWFDAIGLSVFCVLGAAKAFEHTDSTAVAIMMGVVTAVAGGVVRDVIANEVPLILQKEIYATAAFLGAATYVGLVTLHVPAAEWIALVVALVARIMGLKAGWSLPNVRHPK